MEVLVDKDFINLTNGGDTFTMAAMSQLAPQDADPSQLLTNGKFKDRSALVDSISPGQYQTMGQQNVQSQVADVPTLIGQRPTNEIRSQRIRTTMPRTKNGSIVSKFVGKKMDRSVGHNPKLSAEDKKGIVETFTRDILTYERYKQTGDLSCIVSLYKQGKFRRAFDPIPEETVDWSGIGDGPDADQPIEKHPDLQDDGIFTDRSRVRHYGKLVAGQQKNQVAERQRGKVAERHSWHDDRMDVNFDLNESLMLESRFVDYGQL